MESYKIADILNSGNVYSREDVTQKVREYIEDNYSISDGSYNGSNANAALIWGVTTGMVSNVTSGRKGPTKTMLDDIGYEKHSITFYSKKT